MAGSDKESSRRRFERRIAPGINCICYRTLPGVTVRPRHNIGEEILDISWGGARLRVAEQLSRGDPITLELRESASGEVFRARGDVRWVEDRETGVGETHYVGVQFTEIYTPMVQRERFLIGPAPSDPRGTSRSTVSDAKSGADKRRAQRFKVDDYIVTCFRQGGLSSIGLRKNLAREVIDISATGVHLSCGEPLEPGCKVFFTVHLNKFGNTFEADAVVKWCRTDPRTAGSLQHVGIELEAMTHEKRKLLDFMMTWLKAYQAKKN